MEQRSPLTHTHLEVEPSGLLSVWVFLCLMGWFVAFMHAQFTSPVGEHRQWNKRLLLSSTQTQSFMFPPTQRTLCCILFPWEILTACLILASWDYNPIIGSIINDTSNTHTEAFLTQARCSWRSVGDGKAIFIIFRSKYFLPIGQKMKNQTPEGKL